MQIIVLPTVRVIPEFLLRIFAQQKYPGPCPLEVSCDECSNGVQVKDGAGSRIISPREDAPPFPGRRPLNIFGWRCQSRLRLLRLEIRQHAERIDLGNRLGAFRRRNHLVDRFADWGLSSAEADVALFALKGCSIAQIAALRDAAQGTVRAQLSQVYAKAGVSSQPMLMSLFLDDLMSDEGIVAP